MTIDNFSLPVPQWYDSENRIYKDRLIENFNAIEAKLIELSELDAFRVEPPDFSTINIPDTTLSSPDDSVVNLKSFIDITGVLGYPVACEFEGTTCKRVALWTTEYKYIVKSNVETNANETNKFVFIDRITGDITTSANPERPANGTLIGVYCNDKVVGIYDNIDIGLNILELLANMKQSISTHSLSGVVNNNATMQYGSNGRVVGWIVRETGAWSNNVTLRDVGV